MFHARPTSALANRARSTMTAKRQRERIVACLRKHGPMTREAVGIRIGLRGDSLRPRVRELMRSRLVRVVDMDGRTTLGNRAERLGARK